MRFTHEKLMDRARLRPPAFLQAVLAAAQREGDFYYLSVEDYNAIVAKYSPSSVIRTPSSGLGDLVASIAQPIAKTIDKFAGTKLAECGGCKARQAALNKLMPKI